MTYSPDAEQRGFRGHFRNILRFTLYVIISKKECQNALLSLLLLFTFYFLHISIATVNKIDYLLSWNFKHIVKVKTRMKKDKLWKKAKKDFPKDPALAEIHYARLKIHEATKGMSTEEFIKYIKAKAKKVLEQG